MKEFDISDKELKTLIQVDGLEEPSTDFNKAVLSKIKAQEGIKPVKAPKWILLLMAFVFIAPTIYFIFFGDPSVLENRSVNIPLFNIGIDAKFMFISILAILVTGMALIFSRMLKQQADDKTRVKKG